MLQKLKERFTITILNSLLTKYDAEISKYEAAELDAGKRLVSVIAGVYIFQKGIRNIRKHPVLAVEEVALGSILLYSAASGLHKKIIKRPVDVADIRRNQIQGNDPDSFVPAFV